MYIFIFSPYDKVSANVGDDSARSIAYNFGPHFLDIQTVGTELTFNIGPYPMQRFRMIERHYFRDMIIKSFDFEMPFAMPNSTNTWEVMYSMPEMSPELREAMMTCPWEAKSDTSMVDKDILSEWGMVGVAFEIHFFQ